MSHPAWAAYKADRIFMKINHIRSSLIRVFYSKLFKNACETGKADLVENVRLNPVNIQMLPPLLHAQLFPNSNKDFPHSKTTQVLIESESQHFKDRSLAKSKVKLSKEHLISNKIPIDELKTPKPQPRLLLPSLLGFPTPDGKCDANIKSHFWIMGAIEAHPYFEMVNEFAKNHVGDFPMHVSFMKSPWKMIAGWSRYSLVDGTFIGPVPYPAEDVIVFDTENCVSYGPWPLIAIAVSRSFIYGWVSPVLVDGEKITISSERKDPKEIKNQYDSQNLVNNFLDNIPSASSHTSASSVEGDAEHCDQLESTKNSLKSFIKKNSKTHPLVPLNNNNVHSIVIGHHVSYDRARIAEEYDIVLGKRRFLDTLSMHCAVAGLSSQQRVQWSMYKKGLVSPDIQDPAQDSTVEYSEESAVGSVADNIGEEWKKASAMNNLADVVRLHCDKYLMDKNVRNMFVKGTIDDIKLNFQDAMTYCANDVMATTGLLRALWPKFVRKCPHPATFAALMQMGTCILPVDRSWGAYVSHVETMYEKAVEEIYSKLVELAKSYLDPCEFVHSSHENTTKMETLYDFATKSEDRDCQLKINNHDFETNQVLPRLKKNYGEELTATFLRNANDCPKSDTHSDTLLDHDFDSSLKPTLHNHGHRDIAMPHEILSESSDSNDPEGAAVENSRSESMDNTSSNYAAAYRDDPWLSKLDWTVIPARYTKPRYKADGITFASGGEPRPIGNVAMFGKPTWYRKLWQKGRIHITPRTRILPYLLRMCWEGKPVHYIEGHGWCYEVTETTESGSSGFTADPDRTSNNDINSTLNFEEKIKQVRFDRIQDNKLIIDPLFPDLRYRKIPHQDGADGGNVGSLMTKHHLKCFERGLITTNNDILKHVLYVNTTFSFWTAYRERIRDQLVVWTTNPSQSHKLSNAGHEKSFGITKVKTMQSNEERDFGSTKTSPITTDNLDISKDSSNDADLMAMILPAIITMGTVTRRAVEATWMTATNAKKGLAGSELKSKIVAPPGYVFVGADVDSQELWIASLLGDAQFGFPGATAMGWMTLQGEKSNGTDLHSRTAAILGMNRDDAKIFTYGRIYGAGVKYAALLLKKFSPKMTSEEAQMKARELYAATKGERKYFFPSEFQKKVPTLMKSFDGEPRNMCVMERDQGTLATKVVEEPVSHDPKRLYVGGTESFMFNVLEDIACAPESRTPALSAVISDALISGNVADEFITSRVNWAVQSSGVDYLHMLVSSMSYLIRVYGIAARLAITIHDEVRYLVKDDDAIRAAYALQIANIWTRSMFAASVGMNDIPLSVAFFSAIDFDRVLRKEANSDCLTPTNKDPVLPGKTMDIYEIISKCPSGLGKPVVPIGSEDNTFFAFEKIETRKDGDCIYSAGDESNLKISVNKSKQNTNKGGDTGEETTSKYGTNSMSRVLDLSQLRYDYESLNRLKSSLQVDPSYIRVQMGTLLGKNLKGDRATNSCVQRDAATGKSVNDEVLGLWGKRWDEL